MSDKKSLLDIVLLMLSTEFSCGNPGVPANGKKNSSTYQYGYSIKFECNVGYTLQGSSVRTCQNNGLWTGTQPTCQSKLVRYIIPGKAFNFINPLSPNSDKYLISPHNRAVFK